MYISPATVAQIRHAPAPLRPSGTYVVIAPFVTATPLQAPALANLSSMMVPDEGWDGGASLPASGVAPPDEDEDEDDVLLPVDPDDDDDVVVEPPVGSPSRPVGGWPLLERSLSRSSIMSESAPVSALHPSAQVAATRPHVMERRRSRTIAA